MKKRTLAKPRRWLPYAAAACAAALWLAPIPPRVIEHWYSRGAYPVWQRVATTIANFVPFALFDLVVIGAGVAVIAAMVRARRTHSLAHGATRLLLLAAIAAIWFQLAWGLNYRRVPIAESLSLQVTAQSSAALERFALAVAAETAKSAGDLDRSTAVTPARALAEL